MSELFDAPLAWSILPADDIIELLFESATLPVGDFADSDFTNGVFLIESVNFAAIKDSLFSVALVLYYSLELLCVHNESVLYVPTNIIEGVRNTQLPHLPTPPELLHSKSLLSPNSAPNKMRQRSGPGAIGQ